MAQSNATNRVVEPTNNSQWHTIMHTITCNRDKITYNRGETLQHEFLLLELLRIQNYIYQKTHRKA